MKFGDPGSTELLGVFFFLHITVDMDAVHNGKQKKIVTGFCISVLDN